MRHIGNYIYNKKIELLFIVQAILAIFINIFTMLKMNNLVSLLFTSTFFIILLSIILLLFETKFKVKEYFAFILLIYIILCVIFFINSELLVLNFSYYKKAFMFLSALIFFFIIYKVNFSNRAISYYIYGSALLGFCFVLVYFLFPRNYYAKGLTFNYTNPNLTAIILLHIILYSIVGFLIIKNKIFRCCIFFICNFLIYFLLLTKSRTTLISLVAFLLIAIGIHIFKIKKIHYSIIFIILLSPYWISVIYFKLIESGLLSYFDFMVSEGKTLTSRTTVWTEALEAFYSNPIFGSYYQISNGTGISQMHNTHLDILASYGGVVFILTMLFLLYIILEINKKCSSFKKQICLIAFLTIIVMGFGEAILFSGGLGMYILTGGFLILAKNIPESKVRRDLK